MTKTYGNIFKRLQTFLCKTCKGTVNNATIKIRFRIFLLIAPTQMSNWLIAYLLIKVDLRGSQDTSLICPS